MRKKTKVCLIFLIYSLLGSTLNAQSPQLLEAEGPIPQEFISSSTAKYEKALLLIDKKKGKKKDKKKEEQFILESYFAIDNILQSGLVLFNDPATVYINDVLQNLPFANRRSGKTAPRAYAVNSAAVNAFASDQGVIFVTLGLLARLENEAQLAFILAHELVHFQRRHAINKFIEFDSISRNSEDRRRNTDRLSFDGAIFAQSLYARNLEEEADSKGLELFLKSEYDPQVIRGVFSLLYYSYLPFDNIPFDRSLFEDGDFVFPADLWLEQINSISPMTEDKEQEKWSSHPSSLSRLKTLESSINQTEEKGKNPFLLPEQRFQNIRTKARYQLPFLQLDAENFPEAIYSAFLLLQKYPEDIELKKVIGKALYLQAKYSRLDEQEYTGRSIEQKEAAEIAEGHIHSIHHLLSHLNGQETNILALKYNWNLYQSNESDEELQLIIEDLFLEFARYFEGFEPFDAVDTSLQQIATLERDTINSYVLESPWLDDTEKQPEIKTKKRKRTPQHTFWKYAFVKERKDSLFIKYQKQGLASFHKESELVAYYETDEGIEQSAKQEADEAKFGKALGISKIVIVNPFYLSIDERKGMEVQHLRSEKKQIYFRNTMEELASTSAIETTILDVADLSTSDIKQFNDIVTLNRYFDQQLDHYDLTLTPGYQQQQINEIVEKYGTEYFLWTGVIAMQKKTKALNWYGLSFFVPIILPAAIFRTFANKYDFLYYAILFDVESGRRSVIKMDYFKNKDSPYSLQKQIEDVFRQISSQPRP